MVTNQAYRSCYNKITLLKSYDRSVGLSVTMFLFIIQKGIKSILLHLPNATGPIRLEIKYSQVRQNLYWMSGG